MNATFSKPFQQLTLLRRRINIWYKSYYFILLQFLICSSVVQLCCSIVLITDDNGDIQDEGTNYKVLLKSASCTFSCSVHILCLPSFLFYFRAQLKNRLPLKKKLSIKGNARTTSAYPVDKMHSKRWRISR